MGATVKIEQSAPRPVVWEVACPSCGNGVECSMNEGHDGATWSSGDLFGDPFVTCDCGTVIEPTEVVVTSAFQQNQTK